jgi:hypothetical protein
MIEAALTVERRAPRRQPDQTSAAGLFRPRVSALRM